MKKLLSGIVVFTLIALLLSSPIYASEVGVKRLAGSNRYRTAVEISIEGWATSETVILARGDDYADSLVGVGLAWLYDAPILLTSQGRLNAVTETEITRLEAETVIILGGTAAVSAAVEDKLLSQGLNVRRIAGKNRYETAAKISQEVYDFTEAPIVLIVSGQEFPDALAMAPTAYGCPILLVKRDSIPSATAAFIEDKEIEISWVFGGEAAVSQEVYDALPYPDRLAGSSRYGTAAAVAEFIGIDNNAVYIASGSSFPDALALGALAAKDGNPILLVGQNTFPAVLADFLEDWVDHTGPINKFYVAGGETSISNRVLDRLWGYTPTE